MLSPWLYAVTAGPLGFYFWWLGVWHSHRSPKVVSGLLDFTLLAFGVGGVLAFGPFGQLAVRWLFGVPSTLDWVAFLSALGLAASLLARRALNRLVVYHVSQPELLNVLSDALTEMGGTFTRTMEGFEDHRSGIGLKVEVTPWLRSAVIEAHGTDADRFIQALRVRLRERLAKVEAGPSRVAVVLYTVSLVVMTAPLMTLFFTRVEARDALRVLLERLRGV